MKNEKEGNIRIYVLKKWNALPVSRCQQGKNPIRHSDYVTANKIQENMI
jgi:hypothetical protein